MNNNTNKILLIGSGPIVVGQAAEFDYSGSQACKSLKKENKYVILVNSNPATIMTDPNMANSVYIEPLNKKTIINIIEKEHPNYIISSMGGQTALNIVSELEEDNILKKYNIKVIGTNLEAIKYTENRELFKKKMLDIGEPVLQSIIISSMSDINNVLKEYSFPLIVRSAYTLGGNGSGLVNNKNELINTIKDGLYLSRINQVIIEKSVYGWSEIEYEVIRDKNDTCFIICEMENIDPMGIHTGDSIVISPIQTIPNNDKKKLEQACFKIIRSLNIEGVCNIQFAYKEGNYYVIEVNPRASRSSALASKATNFPIASYGTKIAIGKSINEIGNFKFPFKSEKIIKINYTIVKIPRWSFDKLKNESRVLSTSMKSTGEVMGIGKTFEEAMIKAIRSLDINIYEIKNKIEKYSFEEIKKNLLIPTDERLFIIFEAIRRNYNINLISNLSSINQYFIRKIKNIIDMEIELKKNNINKNLLLKAKKFGFSDLWISKLLNIDIDIISNYRYDNNILPNYQIVKPYNLKNNISNDSYYSTYNCEKCYNIPSLNKKILILGSGPIRIGQGIEFDYCTVHAINTIKKIGIETLVLNNNPETVSTDSDISDKLFFDPLDVESCINIIKKENPYGLYIQVGGQTSINLSLKLEKEIKKLKLNTKFLGTSIKDINISENRSKFYNLIKKLNIKQPNGSIANNYKEALNIAKYYCGYPIIVRPSYVIGGNHMYIIDNEKSFIDYIKNSPKFNKENPLLIESFLGSAKEIDVDAIYDGETLLICGIMEQIEEAGIHSGDSSFVFPTITINQNIIDKIKEYIKYISVYLNVIGFINAQVVIKNEDVFILEVNLRASRTIPFLSKVTNIPFVDIASKVIIGYKLKDLNIKNIDNHKKKVYSIKDVIFSYNRFTSCDTNFGPEMKSTGEVMGVDYSYNMAYYKAKQELGIDLLFIKNIGIFIFSKNENDINDLFNILNLLKNYKLNINICFFIFKKKYLNNYNIYYKYIINYNEFIKKVNNKEFDIVLNPITLDTLNNFYNEYIQRICIRSNIYFLSTFNSIKMFIYAFISTKNRYNSPTIKQIDKY